MMDLELAAKILADNADNADKVFFTRKLQEMDISIKELQPLSDKILEIELVRRPLMDKIIALRTEMLHRCVHTKEFLVKHKDSDDVFICKFCETELKILNE